MDPLAIDRTHLWHPYTSMAAPQPVHRVREAEGIWLTLDDGTPMIDAMSSWWCAAHGHRHPRLVAALEAQLHSLPHVMFGGLTHDAAIGLAARLVALLPPGLDRIFCCDSGSVSVEVALKMAVQAQLARGARGRTRFATVRGGYHGDTWSAMSLCDPVTGMHGHFGAALAVQHFTPAPPVAFGADWPEDPARNGLGAVAALFEEKAAEIAGFILEPVVQGAGGMRFYHPAFLRGLRALCDRHGVILIFDEIATGFGRTGRMFAMEHAGVTPDILCLGKALTGGMMSLAVTVASTAIAAGISAGDPGVLMHGPTFMANPLACAAACASLDLLAETDWQGAVARIGAQLARELAPARDLPEVADVRTLGAIGVIEMRAALDGAQVHGFCRKAGVWLRPFGRLLYTMPPFVTGPEDVSRITTAMVAIAREAT
ncbi:adenosylmethionine--8-amino-7-oxononanoate transaminase [Paenirhodobacter hankyongi]|uniref:Adenosylmethionine-8-amino-7-oxononanoate aminotransferase n=1 Tax=Paenirhodobacter hankyongi TaxID=2294033 RepID=A0A421BQ33_9RHOB|nr:adenosylmethionine--8-amino-7-oxononanoate transaminase [Sinirhodobacter hankyongi]RLL64968.1 adenosylmethionine--8-amino-7-oxononanoate transaminase [Sinirhodobacter hankyongi]